MIKGSGWRFRGSLLSPHALRFIERKMRPVVRVLSVCSSWSTWKIDPDERTLLSCGSSLRYLLMPQAVPQ